MAKARTPEYTTRVNIIQRCHNLNHRDFANGTIVCEEWRQSHAAFLRDVGLRPSAEHVLERFPNPEGNYEPGNVQWITRTQQLERDTKAMFLANLNRMPNGCLEWQLSTNQDGYGIVRRRGIRLSFLFAHRYAWFLEYGRWPEPEALHHCDNPPCCDVDHLYEGTQQDNVDDMIARGRHAWQKDGRMGVPCA